MRRNVFFTALGCALMVSACAGAEAEEHDHADAVGAEAAVAPSHTPATHAAAAQAGTVVVFKTPTCGCCVNWVEHMREAGFTVEVSDVASLTDVKRQAGVPADLQSCHTAIVDGLVVEGHVPASTVQQVLAERGDLHGIAVPGMPIGSPGMEVPGRAADPYDVIGFSQDGTRTVVAQHD